MTHQLDNVEKPLRLPSSVEVFLESLVGSEDILPFLRALRDRDRVSEQTLEIWAVSHTDFAPNAHSFRLYRQSARLDDWCEMHGISLGGGMSGDEERGIKIERMPRRRQNPDFGPLPTSHLTTETEPRRSEPRRLHCTPEMPAGNTLPPEIFGYKPDDTRVIIKQGHRYHMGTVVHGAATLDPTFRGDARFTLVAALEWLHEIRGISLGGV